MSAFDGLMNRTLSVTGWVSTGTDGGGNPTGSYTSKGTVKGRINHKPQPDEINGPDLNPVISEYRAYMREPVGFTITERDLLTDGSDVYEIVGKARRDGRSVTHHLQFDLRRVTA